MLPEPEIQQLLRFERCSSVIATIDVAGVRNTTDVASDQNVIGQELTVVFWVLRQARALRSPGVVGPFAAGRQEAGGSLLRSHLPRHFNGFCILITFHSSTQHCPLEVPSTPRLTP